MVEQPAAYRVVQPERRRPVEQPVFVFVEQSGDECLQLLVLEISRDFHQLVEHSLAREARRGDKIFNAHAVRFCHFAYALYPQLLRVVERLNRSSDFYQIVCGKFAVELLFVVPELCVYFAVRIGEREIEIRHALCRHLAVDGLYQAEALNSAVFIELSEIHAVASVCLSGLSIT